MMRALWILPTLVLVASSSATGDRPFQRLHIPELIEGKKFELNLHESKKSFWAGATTATYAYNNESFWGPTLVFQRGDVVSLNVKNSLKEETTTHWHGFHIPAVMDGGPHQLIRPGKTWSPSFKVMNNAGTYWYHPHAHETTQKQLTYGAGGLIIIRDNEEAKLALPRTYGKDDIPLVLTSRRFYKDDQFSFEGDNDKYGDYPIANGTMDAEVGLPAQVVRLRILNAEVERGYDLGFSDNRTFYVIGTDGGLVSKPIALKRMKLMVGERAEILVNLSKDRVGSSVDLMAYNSGQSFGFPGAEPGTSRPNGGYLNNIDFRLLHIYIQSSTSGALRSVPVKLVDVPALNTKSAKERTIYINGGRPSFFFNDKPYDMHSMSQEVVKLGSTEKWTVVNNEIFGHSFHVHDVQFQIVSRSSGPVEEWEKGWKDTMYVPRGESVSFVAKFDDFASSENPFMYHCHMSNHEDGGLMGEFYVVKDAVAFRPKKEHPVTASMQLSAQQATGNRLPGFSVKDSSGREVDLEKLSQTGPLVLFFIDADCPCSRDASPFLGRIQAAYGPRVQVLGVINANSAKANAWKRAVHPGFDVVSDPDHQISSIFGIRSSVCTALVLPGGTIGKVYPGYSRAVLTELSEKVARAAGTSVRTVNFRGAPTKLTAGCPLSER